MVSPPSTAAAFDLLTTLYADPPTSEVWSERETVAGWLRFEAELARAQADAEVLSVDDAEAIARICNVRNIDLDRLWADTRNVGYPILPLVEQLCALLPAGPAGRVHYGATTQDAMDTTLVQQCVATSTRLDALLTSLGDALCALVEAHVGTVMAGRTHAQQAVPTTFGAKMAVFLEQTRYELEQLRSSAEDVRVVSLFGAGGTSAALDEATQVRSRLADRLGLRDSLIPWHVNRSCLASLGMRLSTVTALCARLAREVIDLSRTEVGEVRERGGHHRGASSAMPQKANPITSEAIVGLAVNAAASANALLRAVEAGHERAAGEWQVEWGVLPKLFGFTASAARLAVELVTTLEISADAMRANLDLDGGLVMSEAAMAYIAPVVGREEAHALVYAAALQCRATGGTLAKAIEEHLPPHLRLRIGSLDPSTWTGDAAQICAAACAAWRGIARLQ